jgi:7-keto-8-aminopelargonate synthetase-like enzyme
VLSALRKVQRTAALQRKLHLNVCHAKARLRAAGGYLPDNLTPIVTLIPRDAASERMARRTLLANDIFPSFLRYPGLPTNGCFRFSISSAHRREHLECLLNALVPLVESGRLLAPEPR